jgi:hypothetical protein
MNSYEMLARERKAAAIAEAMANAGITAGKARLMTGDEWRNVARALGVRPPSETTTELVLRRLEELSAKPAMSVREWREKVNESAGK